MLTAAATIEIVGGREIAGSDVSGAMDMVRLVRQGLPARAVQIVIDAGRLTLAEVDRIVMPRKTLANRKRQGTLTPDQTDRLLRVARVIAAAEATFGSKEKASIWLRRTTLGLAGERPLDVLDTAEGSRAVETLLGRIDHGIAA